MSGAVHLRLYAILTNLWGCFKLSKERCDPTKHEALKGDRVTDFDDEAQQSVSRSYQTLSQGGSLEQQRIAHLQNLDNILVRGVGWTATTKWLTQLVTWAMTVFVARLLAPSDYGLVGIATIYLSLLTLFSEFGIGTAVVTLRDLTEDQISQLNTLSLFLGLVGFLISAAAAIPLGKFFRSPNLPFVIIVLSCGFVFSGTRIVPSSLLQKDLAFKFLAGAESLQAIVQALVTLILAFMGWGYWALVLGILSASVTPTILVLLRRRHRFAFPRITSIRSAVHYSRRILIGRLCWSVYDNSDFIVAGRVLGTAPLGAYTLAWTLAHAPLEKLTNLVNRVTPSVFSTIQTDTDALRRYFRNISGVMAVVVFPATIGMALVAREFVPSLLGAKWYGAVIPLELLALHALIRSNVVLLTPLLNVIGEERLVMWNSVTSFVVLPVSFYLASRWGTMGIAAVWVAIYPLLQLPLFSRVFRRINLPPSDYLRALWPALCGCTAMALSVQLARMVSNQISPTYIRLFFEILIGIVTYVIILGQFFRGYLRGILQFVRASRLRPS